MEEYSSAQLYSKLCVYRSGLRLYLVGYCKGDKKCRILKLDHHDRPVLHAAEVSRALVIETEHATPQCLL